MSICSFDVSHFGFEGGNLGLIAQVPDHRSPFTFLYHPQKNAFNAVIKLYEPLYFCDIVALLNVGQEIIFVSVPIY